ncbi:MAG: IS1182 family transposase [Sulfuricella sp.]|nr:IS1182 family transposase [Sulfuricella sp.]
MTTRRYKTGLDRREQMVLPPCLDDYICADNLARAIDAYVEGCDLAALGFTHTLAPKHGAGQPAFDPADLLKLYLYGYLHRVRSSRRLEAEARRNLECIWLLGGLVPGYKTLADFRKDNAKALKAAGRDFALLCKAAGLYGGELVAIDGSFVRGNASKASIDTRSRLEKEGERIEKLIEGYLAGLDKADREGAEPPSEDPALKDKLAHLRERQADVQARRRRLEESGEGQFSGTDPDARLLSKNGQVVAGYNVQIAVDAKHKLLVCSEAAQDGNDAAQLAPMAVAAKELLGVEFLQAEADGGYYSQAQIKACEDVEVTAYVAIPNKSRLQREEGRFAREDFQYDAQADRYLCPAGQSLVPQGRQEKRGEVYIHYAARASGCQDCPLRAKCLPAKTPYRQLNRWEHEAVVERHRARMQVEGTARMRSRAALAEHPFGTFKLWFGWTHFLVRGKTKVGGVLGLMTLCYNLRRAVNLLGVEALIALCRVRAAA